MWISLFRLLATPPPTIDEARYIMMGATPPIILYHALSSVGIILCVNGDALAARRSHPDNLATSIMDPFVQHRSMNDCC